MQARESSPTPLPGSPSNAPLKRRDLYRNLPKRQLAWWLLKDTVNSCIEYRILGLAGEAAFFTLVSLPPLLLGLIGLLGYMDGWVGTDTIASFRQNALDTAATVLSERGVEDIAAPLIDDVIKGSRPDIISFSFAFALWSGSRAVDVLVDTVTVMYGLDGRRNLVATRLLAFGLCVSALAIVVVAMPMLVVGPNALIDWIPQFEQVVKVFYWPVVILLSIAFLTTLYHVSIPVRAPWREGIPGATVALLMWVLGSYLLRFYLTNTVEELTIYGSLAAPVAVLLWICVSAFAVLVGAAVNTAVDRVWPSATVAAARRMAERARKEAAARRAEAAAARSGDGGGGADSTGCNGHGDGEGAVAGDREHSDRLLGEFPERWARFLPPSDVRSRLRTRSGRRY